jgi:outer membrane protein assembly factor BamB
MCSVLADGLEFVFSNHTTSILQNTDQRIWACSIIPDSPSARMMDLPTTRKLAMKNKVVFGTGDHWRAPTLTANMGFVRAVSQSGMPLLTIEHRPRALIGL